MADKYDITVFDINGKPCAYPCKQIVGNLMNLDEIRNALKGSDLALTFFVGNMELSTIGMTNIMTAATQCGVSHLAYISSGGLPMPLGARGGKNGYAVSDYDADFWQEFFPIKESVGIFPGNEIGGGYFFNKWVCESIGRLFAERGSIKFTALRPGLLMLDDMDCFTVGERKRNYDPFFMLMTGHIRTIDLAHIIDLIFQNPPATHIAYHGSNDTPYNNLCIDKAKKELGYVCVDQKPYLDFYTSDKMDWESAAIKLIEQGFPETVIRSLYAFRRR